MSHSFSTSVYHISNVPTKQIQVRITNYLEVKAEVKQNSNPNDGPWYGLNDTVVFKSKNLYIPGYGWGPIRRSEM